MGPRFVGTPWWFLTFSFDFFDKEIVAKVLWFVTLYDFILVEPLVTVFGFERSKNCEDI